MSRLHFRSASSFLSWFILSFILTIFQAAPGAHATNVRAGECESLLRAHLRADERGFEPWRRLPAALRDLESATLLVRVPLGHLSLSYASLAGLGLNGSVLRVPPEFELIDHGQMVAVVSGPTPELLKAGEQLAQRFGESRLGFQILDSLSALKRYKLPLPQKLLSPAFTQTEARALEQTLVENSGLRVGVYDARRSLLHLVYPKAALPEITPELLSSLGVRRLEAPPRLALMTWLLSQADALAEAVIADRGAHFVLSAKAAKALADLGSEELHLTRVPQAPVSRELMGALRECVGEWCPPPEPAPRRTEVPIGTRGRWPALEKQGSFSTRAEVNEFIDFAAGQTQQADAAAALVEILDRVIPPSHHRSQRNWMARIGVKPGDLESALTDPDARLRLAQAWRLIVRQFNPELSAKPLTVNNIRRAALAYKEAAFSRERNVWRDTLTPEGRGRIISFLAKSVKIGGVTEPGGVRRAFIDVLSPKLMSGREAVRLVDEIEFSRTEYHALTGRASGPADQRLMRAWRMLQEILNDPGREAAIDDDAVRVTIDRYERFERDPTAGAELKKLTPSESDPRLSISREARQTLVNAGVLSEDVDRMLTDWHGIVLPGDLPGTGGEVEWTVLVRPADPRRLDRYPRDAAYIAVISQGEVIRVETDAHRAENKFYRRVAVNMGIERQSDHIDVTAPDGSRFRGLLEVDPGVILKLSLKRHIEFSDVLVTLRASAVTRIERQGQKVKLWLQAHPRGGSARNHSLSFVTGGTPDVFKLVSFYEILK